MVLLKGNGKHFQAGADLKWIRAVRDASAEENERVSRATAEAVDRLNRLPVPTVALVQGGCFGGGTGMIAACDVVIAADNAIFSIAEVRWGLTAAIIIPQLSDAISARQLRRYALTGERFDAAEAQRIGLAHQVVPLDGLAAAGERDGRAAAGERPGGHRRNQGVDPRRAPGAASTAPPSTRSVASHAAKRRSPEAAEGLASFAEKRADESEDAQSIRADHRTRARSLKSGRPQKATAPARRVLPVDTWRRPGSKACFLLASWSTLVVLAPQEDRRRRIMEQPDAVSSIAGAHRRDGAVIGFADGRPSRARKRRIPPSCMPSTYVATIKGARRIGKRLFGAALPALRGPGTSRPRRAGC